MKYRRKSLDPISFRSSLVCFFFLSKATTTARLKKEKKKKKKKALKKPFPKYDEKKKEHKFQLKLASLSEKWECVK